MRQLDVEYYGGGDSRQYIYEFCYQPCVYESAPTTMSLHKSLTGAYRAMKEHRLSNFWEWRFMAKQYRKDFLDTFAKRWFIRKSEILK